MKKIKIIGYDKANWSIDKDHANIKSLLFAGDYFKQVKLIVNAEIVYFLWYEQILYKRFYWLLKILKWIKKIKIVATITNDARSNQESFYRLRRIVDFWISPNSHVTKFLDAEKVRSVQLPFYVNPDKFTKFNLGKELIAKKLDIDYESLKNRLVIGSFQRDSLGKNLREPKWQKNPDLLVKIASTLPRDKFVLLLAGPRRHYLVSKCCERSIPFIFVGRSEPLDNWKDDIKINNLSEETINLLYNLTDVYLVTSRSEGGPKAILEAALSKTLIFSTDVGLAGDFLHQDLIYDEADLSSLSKKIFTLPTNIEEREKYIVFNYDHVFSALRRDKYLENLIEIFTNI